MSAVNLNLINFEHPKSKSSKYVLTSPKSLKACQKAGIKPVDLLYKSLEDVKKEFGKKEARTTYERLENERQKKLEACRKIRNELLMEGYPYRKIESPILEEDNKSASSSVPLKINGKRDPLSSGRSSPNKGSTSSLPFLAKFENNSPTFEEGNVKPTEQKQIPLLPPCNLEQKLPRSQSLPSRSDSYSKLNLEIVGSRTTPSMGENEDKLSANRLVSINPSPQNLNENRPMSSTPISYIKQHDNHLTFDHNNNQCTIAITRPSKRKKYLEKKKLLECRKMFDKILAQYKDPEYCLYKYQQIIDNSVERELREQEVKKVQRRIEDGYEMWQDKVLMLQWLDIERAKEQVSKNLRSKMEKFKQKQRNKEIVHAINLNKVKEDDDIKAEILRRELDGKERKMRALQEEKERVILESKSRALAVSELKEQIRNIMTPETFDQKANKCRKSTKDSHTFFTTGKCSNIMQQSHICLG